MRASELEESAVDELKRKLPSLKNSDYDTIDGLMQSISKRHKMTGRKLHDLFVHKYGHTPDHWIKQYKNKLKEESSVIFDEDKANAFIDWAVKKLNIRGNKPEFTFSTDTEEAQQGHHTGAYVNSTIWVYVNNRNLIDIFRTIFHELVHYRQDQLGMVKNAAGYPGSPIEAMADMMAGKYIKIYGKLHPEIFQ